VGILSFLMMLVLEGFLDGFPELVFPELGFAKLVGLSCLPNRAVKACWFSSLSLIIRLC